jgi:hypothetical protein
MSAIDTPGCNLFYTGTALSCLLLAELAPEFVVDLWVIPLERLWEMLWDLEPLETPSERLWELALEPWVTESVVDQWERPQVMLWGMLWDML